METITAEQLKQKLDNEEDFVFINVLPEDAFIEKHIPGSINIPVKQDDFKERIQQMVPDKDTEIVVYCASYDCPASPKAAKLLDQLGYTRVYDYEGGVKDWEEKHYPLDKAA